MISHISWLFLEKERERQPSEDTLDVPAIYPSKISTIILHHLSMKNRTSLLLATHRYCAASAPLRCYSSKYEELTDVFSSLVCIGVSTPFRGLRVSNSTQPSWY